MAPERLAGQARPAAAARSPESRTCRRDATRCCLTAASVTTSSRAISATDPGSMNTSEPAAGRHSATSTSRSRRVMSTAMRRSITHDQGSDRYPALPKGKERLAAGTITRGTPCSYRVGHTSSTQGGGLHAGDRHHHRAPLGTPASGDPDLRTGAAQPSTRTARRLRAGVSHRALPGELPASQRVRVSGQGGGRPRRAPDDLPRVRAACQPARVGAARAPASSRETGSRSSRRTSRRCSRRTMGCPPLERSWSRSTRGSARDEVAEYPRPLRRAHRVLRPRARRSARRRRRSRRPDRRHRRAGGSVRAVPRGRLCRSTSSTGSATRRT